MDSSTDKWQMLATQPSKRWFKWSGRGPPGKLFFQGDKVRERRTREDSSSRRIMRLVSVFTLETKNECLPKLAQMHNASSSIKTAIYIRGRYLNFSGRRATWFLVCKNFFPRNLHEQDIFPPSQCSAGYFFPSHLSAAFLFCLIRRNWSDNKQI